MSLQHGFPVASCKRFEQEEAFQSELPIFRILHRHAGLLYVRCCGCTSDLGFGSGYLPVVTVLLSSVVTGTR